MVIFRKIKEKIKELVERKTKPKEIKPKEIKPKKVKEIKPKKVKAEKIRAGEEAVLPEAKETVFMSGISNLH